MRWRAILPILLLGACTARPAFIPAPQRVFAHFQALPRPARNLAVGALWIDGHGAFGPGAGADNLETQQGISGVTTDNGLAASLSLGFLQYLDLDPSLQSKVMVRLNDVTLVQVKDMAKLDGPKEQPRVYEALRVGSATITANNEVGVAIEARASERGLPVFAHGSSGRQSTFSIEAKDVYLAVHVAMSRAVSSRPITLRVEAQPQSARLNGLTVLASGDATSPCEHATLSATKGAGVALVSTQVDLRVSAELMLATPVGDKGKLFDRLSIEPVSESSGQCAVRLALKGTELVSVSK